jgi:hypothetical protein
METAVREHLSTSSPLGTISPRRIFSAGTTPTSESQSQEDSQQEQERAIQRQEQEFLQRLRDRDREVRAHEAAHLAAGRQYVRGGPSYTYQQGPDGRAYAIGGEVRLDVSPVPNDPEATLRKAEQVRRAALAPAQPSPQDVRVAGTAAQMAARARIEIAIERREQQQAAREETTGEAATNSTPANNSTSINAFVAPLESLPSSFSQYA